MALLVLDRCFNRICGCGGYFHPVLLFFSLLSHLFLPLKAHTWIFGFRANWASGVFRRKIGPQNFFGGNLGPGKIGPQTFLPGKMLDLPQFFFQGPILPGPIFSGTQCAGERANWTYENEGPNLPGVRQRAQFAGA